MSTNTQLTEQLHAAFSAGRYDEVLAMVAEDIETVSYSSSYAARGKEGFHAFFMGFANAFPDINIKHRNIVANGDGVAVEFGATGTHNGPLMTPGGAVPASGRKVELNVCEVHTWRNGKLARIVNYQDAVSLLTQLGLMAQPGAM